jgi:signal transduction histidine kinase
MTLAGIRTRVRRAVLVRVARWRATPVGLRAKMVAFTCGLIALVVAVDLIVGVSLENTRSRSSATVVMAELADGFAATVAERMESGHGEDLASVAHAVALSSEVDDVYVLGREGTIVARDVTGKYPVPSVAEPALMRAMVDHRSIAVVDGDAVTAAAPIVTSNQAILGYIMLRGTRHDSQSNGSVVVALTAFLLLLGAAAATAFSASLTKPLKSLTAATGRIAAGDLAKPAAVDSSDEFGVLAASLNRMMARTSESLTAYQRRERDLTAGRERAEAASLAKSEFLARIGHELRTSLNAIVGFSDLLSGPRSRAMGDRTFTTYARDINRAGRHLLTLVTNIVEYAQTDAGASALKEEVCDAEQLVRSITEPLEHLAEEGGVALTVESTATLPIIRCDRERLGKALANLLSIAIKATRAGGYVAVTMSEDGHGGVLIRITDSGPGVPPEKAETARRTPFARSDSGAALGFALARRIVEQHAGGFRVESYPNIGNVVTIRLPAVSADSLPPKLNPMRVS